MNSFNLRFTIFLGLRLTKYCVKSVRIRSFYAPYFPVFGLNTKKYSVSLGVQSEYGKKWIRKSPHMETFQVVKYCSLK